MNQDSPLPKWLLPVLWQDYRGSKIIGRSEFGSTVTKGEQEMSDKAMLVDQTWQVCFAMIKTV